MWHRQKVIANSLKARFKGVVLCDGRLVWIFFWQTMKTQYLRFFTIYLLIFEQSFGIFWNQNVAQISSHLFIRGPWQALVRFWHDKFFRETISENIVHVFRFFSLVGLRFVETNFWKSWRARVWSVLIGSRSGVQATTAPIFKNSFLWNEDPLKKGQTTYPIFFDVVSPKFCQAKIELTPPGSPCKRQKTNYILRILE